jgi:hypothetical protein
VTTTSLLVTTANSLTDGINGQPFIANTAIWVQGANASFNVRTLANINVLQANTANISNISLSSGNISGNGSITFGQNLTVTYANIVQNIASANVTSNLSVGGDAFIYGNLTISGNVTLDSIGFDDLQVNGSANITNSLSVFGNSAFTNAISATHLVLSTSFTGAPNTAIYAYITEVRTIAIGAGLYANGAFIHGNSAHRHANAGFIHANASFIHANAGFIHANAAFLQANTPSFTANSAALYANGAFLQANTPSHTANSAALYANGAFVAANVAQDQSVAFSIALG